MWSFLGSLASGAGSLLGGLFGSNSAQNIAQQNIQNQMLYAKNRIQWTVADANKAGINPLAALGNATQTYSNQVGDDSLARGVTGAGQDLGRAISALAPEAIKQSALENKLLEAKIANVNSDTVHQTALTSGLVRSMASPGTPKSAEPEPLYIKVRGDRGELIEIPNPKIATSLQTPASWPQQAAMALKAPFEMAHDAYEYYKGVWDNQAPIVRPDITRNVKSYYGSGYDF